ncbi:MAG: TIGR03960 family B12-binding radical SAM protein [Candidatus Magnetomorum sp.]|nr:TIGR03960 family B12-binding radical SAM protein [Candidatus Magnetomorum sp.]
MTYKTFQDTLSHVEMPGRYIGAEANTIKKNHQQTECCIALVFPDMYEIGSSHMGIQVLYHIINQHANALAERVFSPATDMSQILKTNAISLASLETRTPLRQFDIIGFSLLYELNYTNILSILDLSGIPFIASDRDDTFPLIIAGGPCTCNPEPVSDFFDALVIGDGEKVIVEMIDRWIDHNKNNRKAVLKAWSEIEGVYVPSLYEYHQVGEVAGRRVPLDHSTRCVQRAIVSDLDISPFPDHPVVAIGKPVHDRYSLEIARGCTRGCRFCQAGMIYRPVRERSVDTLLKLATSALPSTGYDEISLLSLSSGDYSQIDPLMTGIMAYCQNEHIAVSLPSLRAGTLTPGLMTAIKKVRKTGFTIAPEAASERLRKVINKNITETDIINTVSKAFEMGWQLIKLYFMIGLPTETEDDIEEMIELVKRLRTIVKTYSKRSHINVSISTFIPKPHTPFQWCEQISLEKSKRIIHYLKEQLDIKGVRFKWQDPGVSYMEGIWSRGDRRLSKVLVEAYQQGCRFDGWSDHFRMDLWKKAFEAQDIQSEIYHAKRSMAAPLPWDHVDMRVNRDFLIDEWQKAEKEGQTGDCRKGVCNNCGTCDFKKIKPRSAPSIIANAQPCERSVKNMLYHKRLFTYAKLLDARFLGHLELVTFMIRAFRRAGYCFEHSKGFHPMPKISFSDPLPLGLASEEECFVASIIDVNHPEHDVDITCLKKINMQLPEGLRLLSCEKMISKKMVLSNKPLAIEYEIHLADELDPQKIQKFMDAETFVVSKENRKGKITTTDLKEYLQVYRSENSKQINCLIDNQSPVTIRPKIFLESVLSLDDEAIKSAYIVKLSQKKLDQG